MSFTASQLLRIAVPMAGILVLGGLLAWAFSDVATITGVRPLDAVEEPLVYLTERLAMAIVYGVRVAL